MTTGSHAPEVDGSTMSCSDGIQEGQRAKGDGVGDGPAPVNVSPRFCAAVAAVYMGWGVLALFGLLVTTVDGSPLDVAVAALVCGVAYVVVLAVAFAAIVESGAVRR